MKSAFIPFDERLALINDVIKPGYAALTLTPVDAPVRQRRAAASAPVAAAGTAR